MTRVLEDSGRESTSGRPVDWDRAWTLRRNSSAGLQVSRVAVVAMLSM